MPSKKAATAAADAVREALRNAMREEAAGHRVWSAYADRAGRDGFRGMAKLLKALAVARGVISDGAMKLDSSPPGIMESVRAALDNARASAEDAFPSWERTARDAGAETAARFFAAAEKASRSHQNLLAQATDKTGAERDIPLRAYYVCSLCGLTVVDRPPAECPTCGAEAVRFRAL